MPGPSALYTCRYWAFGSGCPNIVDGQNICRFAHWDTGRLASPLNQRGTCKKWLQGNCGQGHSCYYEHRATGVEGMYQGTVTLSGFNLEVANAAAKAGFNTYNHAALFDLIWGVKRIALRASKSSVIDRRPPKDPVYPDRFRPSGLGDNTKRKRPNRRFETTTVPLRLDAIINSARPKRNFKYKNQKLHVQSMPRLSPVDVGHEMQGSSENTVDLLSDDDDGRGKRQKLTGATSPSHRQFANTSQPRIAPDNTQRSLINATLPDQQFSLPASDMMHLDGHTYVRTSTQHQDDPEVSSLLQDGRLQRMENALRKVKDILEAVAADITWCNKSMSSAFENHSGVLGRGDIHPHLEQLCQSFNTAKGSSLEGVEHLSHILNLVGR